VPRNWYPPRLVEAPQYEELRFFVKQKRGFLVAYKRLNVDQFIAARSLNLSGKCVDDARPNAMLPNARHILNQNVKNCTMGNTDKAMNAPPLILDSPLTLPRPRKNFKRPPSKEPLRVHRRPAAECPDRRPD
jgi:hypothetical protein